MVNINENDSNSNIMTSPATFVSPSKTVDDNYTSELKGSQNDNQFGLTNGDQPSPSKSSPALQPKSPKVSAVVAPMVMANQLADTFDSLPAKNVTSRSSPRPVSKTPDKFESKLIPTSPQKLDASGEEFMMASSDMFGDPEAMDFLSRAGGANSNGFVGEWSKLKTPSLPFYF